MTVLAPSRGPHFATRVALLAALASNACGGAKTPSTPTPPLHLSPITDLVPAAGVEWILVIEPRALFQDTNLTLAIAELVPEERLGNFARDTGVDVRSIQELAIARYRGGTDLWLARVIFDPRRAELAFKDELASTTRTSMDANFRRIEGVDLRRRPTRLTFFGGTLAAGLERGETGPLRAAELFASGRLKRASPALRAPPLDEPAAALDPAPVRAFVPGPFEGESARGFGGLLASSTALAASVRPQDENLLVDLRLFGAWGDSAGHASERLAAVIDAVLASPTGHLLGQSPPRVSPSARHSPSWIGVTLKLHARSLTRRLAAIGTGKLEDLMRGLEAPLTRPPPG